MRRSIPTQPETEEKLASPATFRGLRLAAEAASPGFILAKAINAEDGSLDRWSIRNLSRP